MASDTRQVAGEPSFWGRQGNSACALGAFLLEKERISAVGNTGAVLPRIILVRANFDVVERWRERERRERRERREKQRRRGKEREGEGREERGDKMGEWGEKSFKIQKYDILFPEKNKDQENIKNNLAFAREFRRLIESI